MGKFLVFFSALAVFGVQSQSLADNERIVGGRLISIEEVPHQVVLLYYGTHSCGGSIISSNWILTAAHCVDARDVAQITFRAGSANKYMGGQILQAKNFIQHEKYDGSIWDYDVAVVELTKPIIFTQSMKAIKLPSADHSVKEGGMSLVSGWGNTQVAADNRDLLRATEVLVINNEQCDEFYGPGRITPSMICAGLYQGGKDSCQGDSGGPLIQNGLLIGVVSWGEGCAQRNYPGVYARVTYVRDWIKEHSGV